MVFLFSKISKNRHPETKPKDMNNEKEILRFAQNDSFAITLVHFRHFSDNQLTTHQLTIHKLLVSGIVGISISAYL
jgi:hypothetical protein